MSELPVYLDPEIIVPSNSSLTDLEFWLRLNEWVQDPRPRLSVSTMERFLEIASEPPDVRGLPLAEFWRIVQKVAPRVATDVGGQVTCRQHLTHSYVPHRVDSMYLELLLETLSSRPNGTVSALGTDSNNWSDDFKVKGCNDCDAMDVVTFTMPCDPLVGALRRAHSAAHAGDYAALKDDAQVMFPVLTFSQTAWNNLDTLTGDRTTITRCLIEHLGALNDHAIQIWESERTSAARKARFGSVGILVSPENANRRGNKAAMQKRSIKFGERNVVCEWHTKLQRHTDRIYFAVEESQIFIGAITQHL